MAAAVVWWAMMTASMMGRTAAVMAPSVVWGPVGVHEDGLVALLVFLGGGVFGVHDAVFQVHVVDCAGGWVEAVHAMRHG